MKIINFLLFLSLIVFSTNNTLAQSNKIKVGDKVPQFILKDQNGNDFIMKDEIGQHNMVVYFYPKDDTTICTKEACEFRNEFEVFTSLNALIIGISSDSIVSHKKFEEKYNLPFILLADTNKKVRKLFGVPNKMGFIPGRVTYIINKQGEVIYIFSSMTNARKHVREAKRILQDNK